MIFNFIDKYKFAANLNLNHENLEIVNPANQLHFIYNLKMASKNDQVFIVG